MEQLCQFTLQGHEWQKLRVSTAAQMADAQHLLSLAGLSPASEAAGTNQLNH